MENLKFESNLQFPPNKSDFKKPLGMTQVDEAESFEFIKDTKVKMEMVNFDEMDEQDMIIKTEEIDIKTESCESSDDGVQPEPEIGQCEDMSFCEHCTYQTKSKMRFKRHTIKHSSDKKIHKCKHCTFETIYKISLKRHMLAQRNIHDHINPNPYKFKCTVCSFGSMRAYYLKRHMLTHKDPLEMTTYTCDKCGYKTKQKCNITRHMRRHNNNSELYKFKCHRCPFVTKHSESLKRHMILHAGTSEATRYICDLCGYTTSYKCNLIKHLPRHNSHRDSEMET